MDAYRKELCVVELLRVNESLDPGSCPMLNRANSSLEATPKECISYQRFYDD